MDNSHQAWHDALVKFFMERHKVSEEYADAIAIIKRNYYPSPIESVPFH